MAKTRLMCLGIVAALFAVPASAAQAAKLYIAPSGSDSSACSSDAPCASFNHAYQVADPGDEVEVAAGRYGNQRLDDVAGKDGSVARVWIHPASGATPQITDLLVSASNVRVTGMTMPTDGSAGQPDVRAPAHDVVIENFHATNFYVTGATRDVTIKGGDYGPFLSTGGGSQIKSASDGGDGQDYPVNTVVDGVRLHDYTIPAGSAAHLDCLHVFYHQAVTVQNSRFDNCEHYGILLGSNGSGAAEHDVIQNNYFGSSQVAGFAMRGGPGEDFEDLLVQKNWGSSVTAQTTNAITNVRFYDNKVGTIGTCRAGVDYKRNQVADGNTCDATDIVGAVPACCPPVVGSTTPVPIPTPVPSPSPLPSPSPSPSPGPSPSPSPGPSMPGLVAAYSFDEDGGTTVVDRSGHGNDGTLINDPSRIADGRSGGALSFNGVDQRVNVPDSPSLDLGKGMTIEAWVRPSDVDGYHAAVFKEDRTQQQEGYALYASNGNGKPTGEVATGQRYTTLAGSEPITAGTWTHIAATYDGDTLRVFRDGVEVGSKALSGTLNATSDPLCIGGNSVWGEWFKGAIDEVRVWNVARTASQIQSDSTTAID